MTSFVHTRAALFVYDKEEPRRRSGWETVSTPEQLEAQLELETAALDRVREAFYRDTKHVNSRDHCQLATLAFMRQMARIEEEK